MAALGQGAYAHMAEEACKTRGIDLSLSLRTQCPSPTYMAIHNQEGAMVAAINDMAAMAQLNPDYVKQHKDAFQQGFQVCVLDANLPEETLATLPELVSAPLLADPVSGEKGRRLLPVLKKLTAIKPNAMEALVISRCEDVPSAAKWFLEQGVEQVYISLARMGCTMPGGRGSPLAGIEPDPGALHWGRGHHDSRHRPGHRVRKIGPGHRLFRA